MSSSLPKVSVLSPCYNVAPYIGRFLDSLLAQTYKNLEIILVNDGATDDTGAIITSYIPRLEAQGYSVIYLKQENGGQSSAVNNGLKYVTGKYLTWPDSDDWFTPDSIETKVRFMESHPEAGLMRGNIQPIEEDSDTHPPLFSPAELPSMERRDFFHHLIFGNAWITPVGYMVRTSCLDAAIPGREIYVTRTGGQNWQILLPIAQRFPSWQIPETVGYYLIRSSSHSHSHNSYTRQIAFKNMCEDILIHTLSKLPGGADLLPEVYRKYNRERFELANLQGHYPDMWKYGFRVFRGSNTTSEKFRALLRMLISGRLFRVCQSLRRKLLP